MNDTLLDDFDLAFATNEGMTLAQDLNNWEANWTSRWNASFNTNVESKFLH